MVSTICFMSILPDVIKTLNDAIRKSLQSIPAEQSLRDAQQGDIPPI